MTTFSPRPKLGLPGPDVLPEAEEDDKKISTSLTQREGPLLPLLGPRPVEIRNPTSPALQPVANPQTGFSTRPEEADPRPTEEGDKRGIAGLLETR